METAKDRRTNLQNRALHKLFSNISEQLNDAGEVYSIEIQGVGIDLMYTPILFKEVFWREIQRTMFGIESTTELNTSKINAIVDVLALAFGQRNIQITFPSYQYYLDQVDGI